MKNKRYLLFLIAFLNIIFSSYNIEANIIKNSAAGNIWYVGGTGIGNYTSIEEAIYYSTDGDEIYVYPGIYHENITVNVSVKIVGLKGYQNTIINGSENSIPLIINADNCEISGFTIEKPGDKFQHISCVSIRADNCIFSKNKILFKKVYQADTKSAVEVDNGFDNIISDNIIIFEDNNPLIENGIMIRNNSHNTKIINNNITRFAIGVRVERNCNNTNISKNNIYNNSNGVISYGNRCKIYQNIFLNNSWFGVIIQDGDDSEVIRNKIHGINYDDSGIMIYSSAERAIIKRNKLINNGLYGIYLVNCDECFVTENDLIESNIYIFKHLENIFRKNKIINNYYSIKDVNILGWQKIPGELMILAYFEATWEITWKTFDKKPSTTQFN